MVKKDIKYYEVTLDDSSVYAISLVTDPAIESNFVYLSKQNPTKILFEKEDKHLVVGAVLIPDFPIYRNENGNEFYIQFSKESIEKLAYNYLQDGNQYNTTTQHNLDVDDVCVVESWIKLSENDKSKEYNLDVPVGSWIVALKVNNNKVWERIKSGELKGFSVESFVNLEEIKLSNMNKEKLENVEINDTFWEKLKSIISDALKTPEAEPKEAEEAAEEIVEEEVKPEVEEVKEEEIAMEGEEDKEIAEEVVDKVEENNDTEADKIAQLENIIEELKTKLAEKETKIEEMTKDITKLSKQPSVNPIKSKANLSKENRFDRMLSIMNGTAFKK